MSLLLVLRAELMKTTRQLTYTEYLLCVQRRERLTNRNAACVLLLLLYVSDVYMIHCVCKESGGVGKHRDRLACDICQCTFWRINWRTWNVNCTGQNVAEPVDDNLHYVVCTFIVRHWFRTVVTYKFIVCQAPGWTGEQRDYI